MDPIVQASASSTGFSEAVQAAGGNVPKPRWNPQRGKPGELNYCDQYVRGLQEEFVGRLGRLEPTWAAVGGVAGHLRAVELWREFAGGPLRDQGRPPTWVARGVRWRSCTPVGDGRRDGNRCHLRVCPNCLALRHDDLRRQIESALSQYPTDATVRVIRVAAEYVMIHGGEDFYKPLRAATARIERGLQKSVNKMKLNGCVVLRSLRNLEGHPDRYRPGWAVRLEAHVVCVTDRRPHVTYLNEWPVFCCRNAVRDVGRLLLPVLAVPPSLCTFNREMLWYVVEGLEGWPSFSFRGSWTKTRHGRCGQAKPSGRSPKLQASPAAQCLLDAIGAPSTWMTAAAPRRIDLGWLSSAVPSRDGGQFPLRLAELRSPVPQLFDLTRETVLGPLLRAAGVTGHGVRTAVAFAYRGRWMVLCPGSFFEPTAAGHGNRTAVLLQEGGDPWVLSPLGGAAFVSAIWRAWRPPWVASNARAPRFADPPVMDSRVQASLCRRGFRTRDVPVTRSDDETAAIVELYKALRFGPRQAREDMGDNWTWRLEDASRSRLHGLMLRVIPRRYVQAFDRIFDWPKGVVGAALDACRRHPDAGYLTRWGVVFPLLRHDPRNSRAGGLRAGSIRVVLHNHGGLVCDAAGRPVPEAGVIGVVTVAGQAPAFLQTTKDFYAQVRRRHPLWANEVPLEPLERWMTRKRFREWKASKRAFEWARASHVTAT